MFAALWRAVSAPTLLTKTKSQLSRLLISDVLYTSAFDLRFPIKLEISEGVCELAARFPTNGELRLGIISPHLIWLSITDQGLVDRDLDRFGGEGDDRLEDGLY